MKKKEIIVAAKRVIAIMLVGAMLFGMELSIGYAVDMADQDAAVTESEQADKSDADDAGESGEEREQFVAESDQQSVGAVAEEEQDTASAGRENTSGESYSSDALTEQLAAANWISGVIWLDENEDGVIDADESGIGDYPVTLYQGEQVIETIKTGADGSYCFENLETGEYIIEVPAETIDGKEYLLPLCGISGDNKFKEVEKEDGTIAARSDLVSVSADTRIEDMNAGMREPMDIVPVGNEIYIVTSDDGKLREAYDTLAVAVTACPDGVACTITATQNDVIDAVVTIPADKEITLTSSSKKPWTIRQTATTTDMTSYNARHFYVEGGLTLYNIILAGTEDTTSGTYSIYNGGVYVYGSDARLKMMDKAVIEQCSNYTGGGVYVNSGKFEMDGGEISGNEARSNGGGVDVRSGTFEIGGGEISQNVGYTGGGVYVSSSTLKMDGGEIQGNEGRANGGGVYLYSSSTFKMTGGEISENQVSSNAGGGVFVNSSTFEMDGGEISGNTVSSNGGGVYVSGGTVKIEKGEISGNEASYGGGVYVSSTGILEIDGGEISGNTVSGYGGGVYVRSTDILEIAGGEISGNTASGYGGGVYVTSSTLAWEITGGEISGNTASVGGGVYVSSDTLKLDGGEISGNEAGSGGGVYVSSSMFEMIGGEISENESSSNGGGVFIGSNGTLEITGGDVSGNKAGSNGGGVFVGSSGTSKMDGGEISENEASSNGGGVCVNSSMFEITGGDIKENEASNGGGVGIVERGTVEMNGGDISGNEAGYGGGVNVSNGTFKMEDGEISGNEASYGGGIYVATNQKFEMTDGRITGNTATDGGGIHAGNFTYTNPVSESWAYVNIKISDDAQVTGNTASARYVIPENYAEFEDFPGELLNNDEINYKGYYLVKYDANNEMEESFTQNASSGTGDVAVTLLTNSTTNFTEPDGYVLAGWNTQADGKGKSYGLGETIAIDDSLTLYAVWEHKGYQITEKYYSIEGTQIQADTTESVTAGADYEKNAPVLSGYRYLGYQLEGGMLQTGATVSIPDVNNNYTVIYVYEKYAETIDVSVPVKLLWASFESDDGDVTSPDYYFYNHSSYDINVSLQELTVTDPDGLDLVESTTAKSGADEVALQLDPVSDTQSGWQMTSRISLMADSSGGLLGRLAAGSQGYFDITGTYGGYFTAFDLDNGDYLQPEYEAVFRFELTH